MKQLMTSEFGIGLGILIFIVLFIHFVNPIHKRK